MTIESQQTGGRGRAWALFVVIGVASLVGTAGLAAADRVPLAPHGEAALRHNASFLRGYAQDFRKAHAEKRRITDRPYLSRVRQYVDQACAMAKATDRWREQLPDAARRAYFQCTTNGSDASKGCFAKIEADLGFGGVAAYGMFADELDASSRALDLLASCLAVAPKAQRDADLEAEARERAKQQDEEAQRLRDEQQRQRDEAERQRRERDDQDRRDRDRGRDDERARQDEPEPPQRGAEQQVRQSQGGDQPRTGGGSSGGGAASPAQQVGRPPGQGATLATATTAALAGGAALAVLGATMNVEDAVTPFEINVGAKLGTARGGFLVAGGLELRLLRWKDATARPGEQLEQLHRRLIGYEVYAVAQLGGLFDSWLDCTPAPCVSTTEAGRLIYGELGGRYWKRWYGIGAALSFLDESVTARTAMLDGDMPKDRPGTALNLELLAALARSSKQRQIYGGLRFSAPAGAGFLVRVGINRMMISIDLMYNDVGFLATTGLGMRFAL